MKKLLVISALVALIATLGCKKKEEGGEAAGGETTTADEAGKPGETAEPDDGTGEGDEGDSAQAKLRNNMKHCPNAVEGSSTSMEKTDSGVAVTIKHTDADKLTEVKDRAEHLAGVAGKPDPNIKHTGQGTGGGDTGKCPVGIKNTKVAVKADETSVVLTLEPLEGMSVDDLYQKIKDRKQVMEGGGGHEHGSGQGGGTGGGGGTGAGQKAGKAGKAAQNEGHEHGTGVGAGEGPGNKGGAAGDKDGKPGQ